MMHIKKIVLLTVAVLGFSLEAEAQLSKVCPTIKDINDRAGIGALIQYKNNQVQRRGGVGTPLAGFLRIPTIISTQGRDPFRLGRAAIYDKKGRQIDRSAGKLGCSVRRGECLSRYKFSRSTTAIRQATQNGGAFVKVSDKLCIKVPNAGRCYNVKVRDLCDGRTL